MQCVIVNKVLHEAFLEEDIELHELNYKSSFKSIFKIRQLLIQLAPDIIIGTITPINIILPLIKLSLPGKYRPLFVVRESTVMSYLAKDGLFKNRLLKRILRRAYPLYDRIVCQSLDIRNDLVNEFHVPPSKLHIINNPIELTEAPSLVRRKERIVKFVTVGRMRPEKGHTRILEALKNYQSSYGDDFRYHVIGDFPTAGMEKEIRKKVNDLALNENIVFHGHVDNPSNILWDCDVFLQGSYFEGFPNAVLESCSLGVPVVAYDVAGGTKEIIRPGFNGFLAEDNNITDFVRKMHDAGIAVFDKEAMSHDIMVRFGHKKIVSLYEDFFISLAEGK